MLHLERAIRYEDALVYQEPHDWHAPVRQNLGSVLLAAGRADEAEAVFWEDLKKNAENGWSLTGLVEALKAQGKNDEAALAEARLRKAWASSELLPREVTVANGVRLQYVEQGPADGPVVLMLHGYGDSWFSYSEVLPLMPRTLRVIVPDQRGHGNSDRPAKGYAIDDFASDALQVLDRVGAREAVVVGHSMGSLVALRMAEGAPERVQRLVLLGTTAVIRNEAVAAMQREVNALTDPVDSKWVRDFQMSMFHRPAPEAFVNRLIEESEKLTAHVWKSVLAGIWNHTLVSKSIRVPTMVIGGDKDSVFSIADQRAVADAIPGATFTLLKDVGHGVHWEDPQALAAAFSGSR